MSFFDRYYHRMPDGTLKQISPFNGTEVWCVEERKRGPAISHVPAEKIPVDLHPAEDYCHFCCGNYFYCTPEKARVNKNFSGKWEKTYRTRAEDLSSSPAEFRRVGNLFEIVTWNYWNKNYRQEMSPVVREWMESYLLSEKGYAHVSNVLEIKLNRMGLSQKDMTDEEILERMKPFFGGSHDLILGRRHYKDGAQYAHELCSSGDLTPEEHFQYVKFTVESLVDLYEHNHCIRYISVFQNWLKPAGASFDHLHRQMVGLDEWGVQMEREMQEVGKNPNLYNEYAVNFAVYNSLLVAENDYAIALVEIGHRFPTIAVYSKSENIRPFEHTVEEIRGMSDLIHSIHAAISSQTTCNEEWYYAPFDSIYNYPWHILIKLRVNTVAGFEGNTKIYINPISPEKMRDEIVQELNLAKEAGKISAGIKIGEDVAGKPNALKYYKGIMHCFEI